MTPESNPAFQAAWSAYIDRPDRQPSTMEGFTAGYEARDAEVERLRGALEYIHEHAPHFAIVLQRPDEPHKGYDIWLHDFILETLHGRDAVEISDAEILAALQPEQTATRKDAQP